MAKQGNPLFKTTMPIDPEVVDADADIISFNETFPGEKPMSVREKKRLEELESVITRNFKGFYEVGCALREIREKRLYRETHRSISDYARDLWDMQYAHFKRMVQAADIVDRLIPYTEEIKNGSNWSQNDDPLPKNESQARALSKYPEDKQIEIWRQAVETAEGRITAAHIKRTARQMHGKVVKNTIKKARKKASQPSVKMSDRMRAAFDELFDAVNEERLDDWKQTDPNELLRYLQGLMEAIAEPL